MYTKEKLLQILREYEGTIGGFMDDVVKTITILKSNYGMMNIA